MTIYTWIFAEFIICGGSTFNSDIFVMSFWNDEFLPVTGEVLADVTGVAAELPA